MSAGIRLPLLLLLHHPQSPRSSAHAVSQPHSFLNSRPRRQPFRHLSLHRVIPPPDWRSLQWTLSGHETRRPALLRSQNSPRVFCEAEHAFDVSLRSMSCERSSLRTHTSSRGKPKLANDFLRQVFTHTVLIYFIVQGYPATHSRPSSYIYAHAQPPLTSLGRSKTS